MSQTASSTPQAEALFLTVYCDGASHGNPGAAGIGVVIQTQDGETLREISEPIGRATNNQAEYRALIRGLEEALKLGASRLVVITDSELVIFQMRGSYRVRNPGLRPLWERAATLAHRFEQVEYKPVPRYENSRADELASRAATLSQGLQQSSGRPRQAGLRLD